MKESEFQSIFETLIGYRKLHIMAVACQLNIFTLLKRKPQSHLSLSKKTGALPIPLKTLLDACVGLELLQSRAGRYHDTPVSEHYLVEGSPFYLGHLLHVFVTEAPQWSGLYDRLTQGLIPDATGRTTVEPRRFTLAMHGLGMLGEADSLVEALPIDLAGDMVDVGCGSGIYSVALGRRFDMLRVTLIDTADVLKTTREVIEQSGLADRLKLRAADILHEDYGKNRDAVLLSDVLYGPENDCLAILKSAHRALRPGGSLLIRGYFPGTDNCRPPFGTIVNLARLLWHPDNRPITVEQLGHWLHQTGFARMITFPVTPRSTGLTAVKD